MSKEKNTAVKSCEKATVDHRLVILLTTKAQDFTYKAAGANPIYDERSLGTDS